LCGSPKTDRRPLILFIISCLQTQRRRIVHLRVRRFRRIVQDRNQDGDGRGEWQIWLRGRLGQVARRRVRRQQVRVPAVRLRHNRTVTHSGGVATRRGRTGRGTCTSTGQETVALETDETAFPEQQHQQQQQA